MAASESEPDSVVASSFTLTESFAVVSMVIFGVPVGRVKGSAVVEQLCVQFKLDSVVVSVFSLTVVDSMVVFVQFDLQSEPDSVVVPSVSFTETSVVVSMVVAGGGVPVGPMKGMAVVVQLDVQSVTIKLSSL